MKRVNPVRRALSLLPWVVAALMVVSCSDKQTPISQLEQLCQDLEQNAELYTEDDWKQVDETLDDIQQLLSKHRSEYSSEERDQIRSLKERVVTAAASQHTRSLLRSGAKVVSGVLGGLQGLESLGDSLEQISGALDEFMEELNKEVDGF